jgi:hypothetical protein
MGSRGAWQVLVACAGLLLASWRAPAAAQAEHHFELWTAAFMDVRFPEAASDFGAWTDVHVRRGPDTTLFIARPALFYQVLQPLSLWLGYAWAPLFRDGDSRRDEHRTWQQVQLAGELKSGIGGSFRNRLEQRFMDGSGEVGWRLRTLTRGHYRVTETLMLVLWHELFLGLNRTSWGMPGGVDLSRWFSGVAYVVRRGLRLETGYLGQLARREPNHIVLHALSVNVYGSW